MPRTTILAVILIVVGLATSCPVDEETAWVKTFSFDEDITFGESVFVRPDGSIVVAGQYVDDERVLRSVVAKLDGRGNEIWRYVSSSASRGGSHMVMPTRFGGALVALDFLDDDGERTGLMRLNKHGQLAMTKHVDFIDELGSFGYPAPTADGGFLIGGATRVPVQYIFPGIPDPVGIPFISKFDYRGNHQWTDSYEDFGTIGVVDIAPTSDDGFIAVHSAFFPNTRVPGPALSKLDHEGRIVWFKEFEDYQLPLYWVPSRILQADDGGFIVVGWTEDLTGLGGSRIGFIRIDAQGNLIGYNKLRFVDALEGVPSAVKTPGDGFAVAFHIGNTGPFGITDSDEDMALLHVSDDLEPLWLNRYGTDGDDYPRQLEAARGGGYIMVGTTREPGTNSVFTVVRTDAEGNAPNLRSSTTDIDSTAF